MSRGGTGGSKEEDNPKRKGFRVRLDLRLGAMRSPRERKRERDRDRTQSQKTKKKKEKKWYECMKYA